MERQGSPRVAIIIPCHNDGATLPDAIRSAVLQDPDELVVVDDGSTDPFTLEVLDRFERAGTRVLHQENRGLAEARNAGLRAVSAAYVVPLDADDGLAPGAVGLLTQALDAAGPEVAAAWGKTWLFGDVALSQRRARSLDPWAITYLNELPVSALMRRELVLQAGGWVLKGGYEDWDLWMTLAQLGHTGIYVDALVQYRRVGLGRMLSDSRRIHDDLWALLVDRHGDLFDARPANRRRSTAPLARRLLFPLIDALPFARVTRQRLVAFSANPVHVGRVRLQRLKGRRSLFPL